MSDQRFAIRFFFLLSALDPEVLFFAGYVWA